MKSAYPASYNKVHDALVALCQEESSIGVFQVSYTADKVAERAGVSVSTARTRLEELSQCRHFTRVHSAGRVGYRYEVLMASLDR